MVKWMRWAAMTAVVMVTTETAYADWQLSYDCVWGPHDPSCGGNPGPTTTIHPTLFRTKTECEAAPTQCPNILDHGGAGCDHTLTNTTNKTCTCLFAPCDDGTTSGGGGGGSGGNPLVNLPGSTFLPDGSLLTNSQFENIAGGYHGLGDISLMGTGYGDSFFNPHYTDSTANWLQEQQERYAAQLAEIMRKQGLKPEDYPSLFETNIPNPPTARAFENTYVSQTGADGVAITGSTPILLRPPEGGAYNIALSDQYAAQLTPADITARQKEAATLNPDSTIGGLLADTAMALPEKSMEVGAGMAAQELGEQALDARYGKGAGKPLGDAVALTKVAQKVQEGNYAGATAEAVDWGIGKIPLPSIAMAQAGGKVVAGVAKEALVNAFTAMNEAVGRENPREHAEQFIENFKQDASPGQRAVMEWLGW